VSVSIRRGRSTSGRNIVTSGSLVPDLAAPPDVRRDLPEVGAHVAGPHGYVGPASKAAGLEEGR
jgi:hypothetical protein